MHRGNNSAQLPFPSNCKKEVEYQRRLGFSRRMKGFSLFQSGTAGTCYVQPTAGKVIYVFVGKCCDIHYGLGYKSM